MIHVYSWNPILLLHQVVSMASVAASGGYLTALGADVSLAQETTITGSIGVIMARPAIHALLRQYGLNPQESMCTE